TNSEWIRLGGTVGRLGAATNQAADQGYRIVRNGQISARNSAPGSERAPKMRKRPVGTCCPDLPCECRGDWIRTSDLLNPIHGVVAGKVAKAGDFSTYKSHTSHIVHPCAHIFHRSH